MPESPTVNRLREISPTLTVGILTADLLSLGAELALLEGTGAQLVHVDVMDGCFCPMMTVGPPFIKALKTPLLKDVHLMIHEPLSKIADYVEAGADIISVQIESDPYIQRALQQLRDMTNVNDTARGIVRGIALNPGTPLEALEPLLDDADLVSILAINPGFRGQAFFPSTFRRIERVQQMVAKTGRRILVSVDGGVTKKNIAEIARTGVDIIVTGSAVFDGKTPEENAKFMLAAVRSSRQ
jgi:ribulose-phosphate 3-epimerase